ncbi:MAG: hypothetical protein FJ399_00510 [Verrucomicrobia bacterium]|nr:hypothetical protein [Verrucomicrobiota bacterium]
MGNFRANPDASHSSWIPASAFRPLRGRKGDFVAVSPDKVGPQGAFITPLECDECRLMHS